MLHYDLFHLLCPRNRGEHIFASANRRVTAPDVLVKCPLLSQSCITPHNPTRVPAALAPRTGPADREMDKQILYARSVCILHICRPTRFMLEHKT